MKKMSLLLVLIVLLAVDVFAATYNSTLTKHIAIQGGYGAVIYVTADPIASQSQGYIMGMPFSIEDRLVQFDYQRYGRQVAQWSMMANSEYNIKVKAPDLEWIKNESYPDITEYVPSYDGRNKEPVVFRSKLPVVLIIGAEGIAVGMSTKILPHNIREVIEAEKAYLNGEKIKLYPDFPTGGEIDVSEYNDGNGKVLVRAKLDISDPKKIVIREIPFGCTTESIIQSVENAVKQGRIKSAEINDFTTSKAEIEIKLQRGVYAQDVVDSLYAFTECEQSISCNLLVIKDNLPVVMTVSEVIAHQAKQLVGIFKDELELELKRLFERLHLRTLERIFIEESIYK